MSPLPFHLNKIARKTGIFTRANINKLAMLVGIMVVFSVLAYQGYESSYAQFLRTETGKSETMSENTTPPEDEQPEEPEPATPPESSGDDQSADPIFGLPHTAPFFNLAPKYIFAPLQLGPVQGWIDFARKVLAGIICRIRIGAITLTIEDKEYCCQYHGLCLTPAEEKCREGVKAEREKLKQEYQEKREKAKQTVEKVCEHYAKSECQMRNYDQETKQYLPCTPEQYAPFKKSCLSNQLAILKLYSIISPNQPISEFAKDAHEAYVILQMSLNQYIAMYQTPCGSGTPSGMLPPPPGGGGGDSGTGPGGGGGGTGGGGTGGGGGAGGTGGGGTGGGGTGGGTGGGSGSGGEGGTGGGEGTGDDPTPKLIAPPDGSVYEGGDITFKWEVAEDRTINKSWLNFILNGWNAEYWPEGKKEMGSATTFTINEEDIVEMLLTQDRLQSGQDIVWSWKVIVQYKEDINMYTSEVWTIMVDTRKIPALNVPILVSPENEFLVDMNESDSITFSWKPGLGGTPDKYWLRLTSLAEGAPQKVKDMGTKTELTIPLKDFHEGWRPTIDIDVEWQVSAQIDEEYYLSEIRLLYLPILTPQLIEPVNNFVWGGSSDITLKWEPGEGSQPGSYSLTLKGSNPDQEELYNVGTDTFAEIPKSNLADKVTNNWGPYLEWYVMANYYTDSGTPLQVESEHRRIRISS